MRDPVENWIRSRFPAAAVSELAGDASTRRFFRISPEQGESGVLMDYGAPFAGLTDDQRLAQIFEQAGLPVAAIRESLPDIGCLLLEDLGDVLLEDQLGGLDDQGETPELLLRAAELAGRIARDGSPALAASDRAGGPALDEERFAFEMDFFIENFVEKHLKITGDHGRLRAALGELARRSAETPQRVLCHRDYHSRNLMLTPERGLVLIDLQDARWGPDSYDIASLAFDAYLDRPVAWVDPLVERYLQTAGIDDDALFSHRVHRVAAQRMIKALGTFGYQIAVVQNHRYIDAIPRTLARLREGLPASDETSEIYREFESLGLFAELP